MAFIYNVLPMPALREVAYVLTPLYAYVKPLPCIWKTCEAEPIALTYQMTLSFRHISNVGLLANR